MTGAVCKFIVPSSISFSTTSLIHLSPAGLWWVLLLTDRHVRIIVTRCVRNGAATPMPAPPEETTDDHERPRQFLRISQRGQLKGCDLIVSAHNCSVVGRTARITGRRSRKRLGMPLGLEQSPYAAVPLDLQARFEPGARLYVLSMIGTSRSGSSLFITYSSTSHRIRSGNSE
jgi:hypothetical protein